MSKFDSILNVGIPIDTDVQLDLEFLFKLAEGNEKAQESIINNVHEINRYLYDLCGVYTSRLFPFFKFTIFVDPLTLKKDFYFSINNIIRAILFLLNEKEKNAMIKNQEIDSVLIVEKLDQLGNIKYEDDLKRGFPELYDYYLERKKLAKDLLHLNDIINKSNNPMAALALRKEAIDELQKDGCKRDYENEIEIAKDFSISSFSQECADIILNVLGNSDAIEKHLEETKIKLNFFTREMKDKLLLYIISCYIDQLNDKCYDENKQKYIYYLNACFKSVDKKKFSNISLSLPRYKYPVTLESLYEDYKKALVKYPYLSVIDFSDVNFENMSKEEVIEFTSEFLNDLKAKWVLIPAGTKHFSENDEQIKIQKEKQTKKDKEEEYNHLLDKYIEKKDYYATLDPMFVIQGINTFNGYFACVFSNGIVVLDKYFNNAKTGSLSRGDAAYIMPLDQFYVLSHYDRSYLYGNKLCKRVYHTNGWQETINGYISKANPNINTPLEMKKLLLTNEIEKK